MKKYVAVLGLMLAGCHMAAADVRGVVVDENEVPVRGASCVVYTLPDSVYFSSTSTDRNGAFQLPEPETRQWYLSLAYIGYETQEINDDAAAAATGPDGAMHITLNPAHSTLSEIVVKGRKPQITMKDGILSYNIKDILATSVATSAHALLTELPLITSNDGTALSLTGAPM